MKKWKNKQYKPETSVVPVNLRECKNTIYNIFAKPKYEKLNITKKAYIKLMCYINLIGDYEISGFGRIQNGTIIDFKILKQEVKSAYVECDEDAVLEFIRSIPKEELEEWELDWHSHVNMTTTPSGVDWDNYENMSILRGCKQFPAMIANKKQDVTLINYISENNYQNIKLYITDEDITNEEIDEIYNTVKNDIKTNCTKTITIQSKSTYPLYNNYWNSRNTTDDYYDCKCKSCGVPLLTMHELTTGLCKECELAVEETIGGNENGRL